MPFWGSTSSSPSSALSMELLPAPVSPTTPITTGFISLHRPGFGRVGGKAGEARIEKPGRYQERQLARNKSQAARPGMCSTVQPWAVTAAAPSAAAAPPVPALLHGCDVLQPGRGAGGGCQAAAACRGQRRDDSA
jgi:hypothetical protein